MDRRRGERKEREENEVKKGEKVHDKLYAHKFVVIF